MPYCRQPTTRFFAAAALILAGIGPVAAERYEATYVLQIGGLEIGRFETRFNDEGEAYRLSYAAETTGVVGFLFPFSSSGASEGKLADPGPVPTRFAGQSRRPDGQSSWAVDFGPNGQVLNVEVEMPDAESREPVPERYRRGPDPLALALRATQGVAPGARLDGVAYDGKRAVRFELACDTAERDLGEGDRVLGCNIDGEQLGGRWRPDDDDGDSRRRTLDRDPVRVFFSRSVVPARYWPVRIEAGTRFGTAVVRLTDAE